MSGGSSDEEKKHDGTAKPRKVDSASSDLTPARSTFTAEPPTDRAFRVRFADADDLAVVSAYLQDAITATTEMIWQKAERRFVMVVHRFMWEKRFEPTDDGSGAVKGSRVNCGLRFEGVERVRFRGFDPADMDKVLNLLTVQMTGKASVTLLFSEDAAIRIDLRAGRRRAPERTRRSMASPRISALPGRPSSSRATIRPV